MVRLGPNLRGDDRITGMGCQFLTALGLAIPIVTGGLIGLAPPFTETFDRDADLAAVFSGYQWPVLGYLLSFVLTYGLLATLFWAAHVQDRRRRGGRAAASRRGPGIAAAAWLGLLLLTLVLPVGTGPML